MSADFDSPIVLPPATAEQVEGYAEINKIFRDPDTGAILYWDGQNVVNASIYDFEKQSIPDEAKVKIPEGYEMRVKCLRIGEDSILKIEGTLVIK